MVRRISIFHSTASFLTISRFFCYVSIRRRIDEAMERPRIVMLYLGEPIKLPTQCSIKSLTQLAFNVCNEKEKQFIFNHRHHYPLLFKLVDKDRRLLKQKMHNEFFRMDEILERKFVKKLRFPKQHLCTDICVTISYSLI